jgi:outer membrane lipoprotein SlyB
MRQQGKTFKIGFFIGAMSLIVACSTSAPTVTRNQLNSSFDVRYGTVETIERVKIQSQATQGAVMGGLIGGLTSGHSHRGQHALEGAVAGALLTALFEGNRRGYQYTVDFDDGSVTKVITESAGIVEGDCVAVELGRTANIRRTSAVHCEHTDHRALADPVVHAKRQTEAAECHAAKNMALQATTEEATDIALKKVRVFCEG